MARPSQHNDGLSEGPPRFMSFFRTPQGTMLVGSCTRGMSRSIDDGATWEPVTQLGHVSQNCFALDPDGALLVATSGGLARSTDDGVTWDFLDNRPVFATLPDGPDGPHDETVYRLLRLADGRVLASTNGHGVWMRDTDGWRPRGLDGAIVYALAVAPSGALLAGTRGDHIWRSTDEGRSWQSTSSGLAHSYVHCLYVHPGGAVYAGTGRGIARSDDDGRTWVADARLLAGNRVFAIAGTGDGRMLAGGYTQVWSGFGETWETVDPGLTPDEAWTVLCDGDRVLAGAKIGVIESADLGATWRPVGQSSVVYDFARRSDGTVLAGGDRGVLRVADWAPLGDLGQRAFALLPLEDDGLLAGTVAGGVHRYGGGQWTKIDGGLDHPDVYDIIRTRRGRLLAGTGAVLDGLKSGGIFVSDDGGVTWHLAWVGQSVYQLVEASDGTLFAGARRCRMLRSDDGGDRWTACPPAIEHEAKIYSLAIDHLDRLYLGAGGELLRSGDGAMTWELVGDGLDGVSVYAIDESDTGTMVAATSGGMFASHDAASSWQPGTLARS